MKVGFTGLESAGKSQLLAVRAIEVLHRNRRWAKKRAKLKLPHVPRMMAFDTPMSQKYIQAVQESGHNYLFFQDFNDLMYGDQMDIFIHEITKWFPQKGSDPLTPDQIEFLTQGAKEGNNIYFACQDYSQVHKQFRFLTNQLFLVQKLIGSERPIRSSPPIKYVWGVVLYWSVDPRTFEGDNQTLKKDSAWPGVYFINREDTELYDTSFRVRGSTLPPVKMVEQVYIYVDALGKEIKRTSKWVRR